MTRTSTYLLLAGALVAGLATSAPAQDRMPGDTVAERTVTMMTSLDWHSSLAELTQIAAEKQKPIFWLQIVGELDGDL